MQSLGDRLLLEKVEEEVKEGEFQAASPVDSFVYKGKVVRGSLVYDGICVKEGDVVIFAKYSPDTHEVVIEGKAYKSVIHKDVLIKL